MSPPKRSISGILLRLVGLMALAALGSATLPGGPSLPGPDRAAAAPATCFGKKVNRVITADGVKVRVAYREVVWVEGEGTTVIGRPYSRICAGQGSQTIRAGKGRSRSAGGPGNDRIILHRSSNRNEVRGGTGNDYIEGSKGHDIILGGPAVAGDDTDSVFGRGGNDRITDLGGVGNRLFGESGSDQIRSLGLSVSAVHGGNGTDFLYSNGGGSRTTVLEKVFGERGNDRLYGNATPNNGPALFDPGTGDDWVYGTESDDTILFSSGIKKIFAYGGNDLVVATSFGRSTVDGGSGTDTMSFATHTPPGYRGTTGVYVNLAEGFSIGASRYSLTSFEDVIGSSFDDRVVGSPVSANWIRGGLGNDELSGNPGDDDRGDGGIGVNECRDFAVEIDCNADSPGDFGRSNPVVQIEEDGVMTVIGSSLNDSVGVEYDLSTQAYLLRVSPAPVVGGLCTQQAGGAPEVVSCPAPVESLTGVLVYGDDGDDAITIGESVPSSVTTTINGGSGRNLLTGGSTKDNISSETGTSAGTVIDGRDGSDLLHLRDDVTVRGGDGPDVLRVVDPCTGGLVSGGPDEDGLVFAGAKRGVRADLGEAYAEWAQGGCNSKRLSMMHDIENLEGSAHDDALILGLKRKTQDGKGSLLGREGIDYLNSRNGTPDTVTTGSNGRRNTVIADRIDKVIWGWGLSGF